MYTELHSEIFYVYLNLTTCDKDEEQQLDVNLWASKKPLNLWRYFVVKSC